jgi:hypothetical protein
VTSDELKKWRGLCEWLDQQKYKAAHYSAIPQEWRPLTYVGGNPTGQRARDVRYEVGVIFYQPGWGWRLRIDWRDRLEALEANCK